jgi:hypothetical protein
MTNILTPDEIKFLDKIERENTSCSSTKEL